jgi:integrase
MAGKRRFGTIRRLNSGRWQARYRGPDGIMRAAHGTFARKSDADRWLALAEAQIVQREWHDPAAGKVELAEYAKAWVRDRPGLRPRTVELYAGLLARHIAPYLGRVPLAEIDPPMVRAWRTRLLGNGVSATTTAKAYRLLRAVLHTAADDEIIRRNPCRIRGADVEPSAERPVLTSAEVVTLARSMPPRFVALVLLATYASLRWGEVAALRRRDLDLEAATVMVTRALVETGAGRVSFGPPKSRAGARVVAFPRTLVPLLAAHLANHTGPDLDALVFTGERGAPLRRSNFRTAAKWSERVKALGREGLHFHDLRHTGNALASKVPGTTLRDLMERMGHDSTRAALIYLHTAHGADRAIADALPLNLDDTNDPGEVARKWHDEGDEGPTGVPARL